MKDMRKSAFQTEYAIIAQIWRGHLSTIYKCKQISTERIVAAKVLHPFYATDPVMLVRFRREINILTMLDHPHIVKVIDSIEDVQAKIYVAILEFLDGESMRSRMMRNGFFSSQEAVSLVSQICSALSYIHEKGIVHRDIQPSNIVILRDGLIKVVDFNIAQVASDGPNVLGPSKEVEPVAGTVQYMSPEQIRGEIVDRRADIYSLGCVLYEMVTGRPPFVASNSYAVLYRQFNEKPSPPSMHNSSIPQQLENIILKAIEKKPELRYQSVEELTGVWRKLL